MRVLIVHGYLLGGTGSNVYTAELARALVNLGAEVHLVCQERAALASGFVEAAGDWDSGSLRVHGRVEGVRCTAYRPDLGGLLPVYVADRYEGVEARPFTELDDATVEDYVRRNVAAVREVVARARPDVAFAGHLVMAPAVLARALAGTGVPYAVKVHGSALEYTVARQPERFVPWAREGLAGAGAVLVGSRHTATRLWTVMDDDGSLAARTRLGPPGVDIAAFRPREAAEAAADVRALARELGGAGEGGVDPPASSFARDDRAAGAALMRLDPRADRLVAFVGKLIVSKGVDLLAAAWPLVLQRLPAARLALVGFGAYRKAFERLVGALAAGDLAAARALAHEGRAAEGGPRAPLRHLLAFLDALEHDPGRDGYFAAAARLPDRLVVVGRLDHAELARLLPACEAIVVPSTFPEAFGMVAAEAAACGALPVCADHSGLAEVAGALAQALPEEARRWLRVPVDDRVVTGLADRVVGWLQTAAPVRTRTRDALGAAARERYSWEGVARGVLRATRGDLGALPPVSSG
ncbi:MAG: glycosyltransferase [Solirubrobacteraceae bacterium MAG38_C4-C5]|nr:glycosyltransferase [Candidatus Siliceabacter maunaloa]